MAGLTIGSNTLCGVGEVAVARTATKTQEDMVLALFIVLSLHLLSKEKFCENGGNIDRGVAIYLLESRPKCLNFYRLFCLVHCHYVQLYNLAILPQLLIVELKDQIQQKYCTLHKLT